MREPPGEYKGVQQGATGEGRTVRMVLAAQREAAERQQRRRQKVSERIEWSPTKKLMTGIFLVLYLATGIPFLFTLMGLSGLLPPGLYYVFAYVGLLPFMWWQPNPNIWQIGPLAILKVNAVALITYMIIHAVLVNVHRAILEGRVKVSA